MAAKLCTIPFASSFKHAVARALACIFVLTLVTPAFAERCIVDTDGANDDPGQKDVTQFCSALGAGTPYDVHTKASLDLTSLGGSNTADLCLLFDSDADGRINLSLCTTVAGAPVALSDVRLLACDDSTSKRCNSATQINVCSGNGASCLSDADCTSGTCAASFDVVCTSAQVATDPFPAGDDHPLDTVIECAIDLDAFGPDGETARLINMGAFSSSIPYSSMSDSVLPPLCESDDDCKGAEVCHLASGECYVPEPEGCTGNADCAPGELCDADTGLCVPGGCTSDADCPAGKVCNVEIGECETPVDTGCTEDSDCAAGLRCEVDTGECYEPGGSCDDDTDCRGGQVCNTSTGTCIDPDGDCDDDADCGGGQVCNTSTGTCIDPDGSCDDDADCGGGQICNPATGTCQDPTDECVVDADCDDGFFCNGAEICNRLTGCTAGVRDCDDGVACTVDGCDEAANTCIHAASNAACDDGLYCNGAETCDVGAGCVVGEPVDCSGPDDFCGVTVCDEESRGCVLAPKNEGFDCAPRAEEACVLSAVCSAGACLVTPLCDEQCERCDPEGCASLCGNPHANANDDVNSTDALFTLRAAVELEECSLCVCDVTGDGAITATDTLMMLRQVVGLGDIFVCPLTADGEPTTTSTTTTTLPELP